MRIKKLYIETYKKFVPSITIDLNSEINVLIGINGSGKSSIFEAIALIFSEVKQFCIDGKTRETKINFKIDYSYVLNEIIETTSTSQETKTSIEFIELTSSGESGLQYSMTVNGNLIKDRKVMQKYLPDNLIFYYAGYSSILKNIVLESESHQAKELYNIKDNDVSLIPELLSKQIIYIKEKHYPILFLMNYYKSVDLKLPLSNQIYKVNSVNLHLKKPDDFANNDAKDLYKLSGFLRTYLDQILRTSYSGKVEFDIDDEKPFIHIDYHKSLLNAIYDIGKWSNDYEYKNDTYLLFHFINLLLEVGILEKISVFISTDDLNNSIDINDLSEGEQQLITISALKQHLLKKNSVLIMDEPDAFLHPKRQTELIPFLKNIFSDNSYNQILLATHSANLLNNASNEFVKVLLIQNGKISDLPLNYYGRTIASVNYNLMNVNERPKEIQDKLNSLFEFLELEKIKESEVLYIELLDILGNDDEDLIRANIELEFLKSE